MMSDQEASTCLALHSEEEPPADIGMKQGDAKPEVEGAKSLTASTLVPVAELDATPNTEKQEIELNDPAVLEWMIQTDKTSENENHNDLLWRDWEDLYELDSTSKELFDFTVLSYNILSQDLVEQNPTLYTHCSPIILGWDYRWQSILQELQHWDADVLCLQEVQEDHYREQVQPSLSALGYSCHYKRRTGRKTDGCCTCFKLSRFTLLHERHVEYFRPGIQVLNRDNIGLVLLLSPILKEGLEKCPHALCVANTHLLFNPRRGDIKLAQLALLLAEVDKISQTSDGAHHPILLCGDLNATPGSPLYRFMRNGILNYKNLPAWKVSGQEKFCPTLHPWILSAPLWPDALGISDHCQFAENLRKTDRLVYTREQILHLRFCECALQRPPELCQIVGVTDRQPDPDTETVHIAPPMIFANSQTPVFRSQPILQHNLLLTSVYSHFLVAKGRPEVTTIPLGIGSTVDYIFYSAEPLVEDNTSHGVRFYQDNKLKLLGRLCLLSENDLWPAHGLPNQFYCSDHLCLLARFALDISVP
ncbi:protein angel homolog 1 [Pelobates fuscus]|uniref:protein angel homolog 1 n=1 Tax=Pelobates fuscus TaxID=191477 RepID=UPI002FE4972D